jgi:SpoVK/Ycf46/Vps4 family AAA+-type ATPase
MAVADFDPKSIPAVTEAREFGDYIDIDDTLTDISKMMAGIRMRKAMRAKAIAGGNKPALEGYNNVALIGPQGVGKTSLAETLAFRLRDTLKGQGSDAPIRMVKTSQIVGVHVGEATRNTQAVLDTFKDGIVIFDEIDTVLAEYSYGISILNTINTHTGHAANRNSPIVLITLYPGTEQSVMGANSGFSSRFPNILRMPGYEDRTLLKIFKQQMGQNGLDFTPTAARAVEKLIHQVREAKKTKFGNGREIENIVQAITNNIAYEMQESGSLTEEFDANAEADIVVPTITDRDIPIYDAQHSRYHVMPRPVEARTAEATGTRVIQMPGTHRDPE